MVILRDRDDDVKGYGDYSFASRDGTIGITVLEGKKEEQVTTLNVEKLEKVVELMKTLEWDQVQVNTVSPDSPQDTNPMLVFRPSGIGFEFDCSDSGVCIAPVENNG